MTFFRIADTMELIADTCKLANIPMITPDNIDITDVKVWDSMHDDTTQIFQWEGDTGDTYIKKLLSDKNIQKFQKIDKNVDRMTLLSAVTMYVFLLTMSRT